MPEEADKGKIITFPKRQTLGSRADVGVACNWYVRYVLQRTTHAKRSWELSGRHGSGDGVFP